MSETPEITILAGEAVSSLARLVSAAVLPALLDRMAESDRAYNVTLQTHLEIMQSQGRRLDNLRTLYNEQGDLIGELREELDNLVMRHRLANTKLSGLDGARAGHQNHIASLFDQVAQLQAAMTDAEAAIADLEDFHDAQPRQADEPEEDAAAGADATTNPYLGILASVRRLNGDQLRDLMPEQPSIFGSDMATSYTGYSPSSAAPSGDWLKDWTIESAERRPLRSGAITFGPSGEATYTVKATQPAPVGSDQAPASCADQGRACCGCPTCHTCGKRR